MSSKLLTVNSNRLILGTFGSQAMLHSQAQTKNLAHRSTTSFNSDFQRNLDFPVEINQCLTAHCELRSTDNHVGINLIDHLTINSTTRMSYTRSFYKT